MQYPVVITVIAVSMMQVAAHQVVNMITMWHGRVAAVWSVDMRLGMAANIMFASATIRMLGINFDNMFGDATTLFVLQMARFQIISMSVMFDCNMSATGSVVMF